LSRQATVTAGVALVTLVAAGTAFWLTRPAPVTAPAASPSPRIVRRSPSPPATVASTPSATPSVATTLRPAAAPRLRVESDVPGAQVFLDRRFLGTAPVDVDDVEPGNHRLNVSAPGYEMYAENIDTGAEPRTVSVRFKEVRLDARVEVSHKHGLGSCHGTLSATPQGLRYDASDNSHAFTAPLTDVTQIEADYLAKTLKVKVRGGKGYTFTGAPDALLTFQKSVSEAKARLAG
jgi:hypothetical protein